MTKRTKWTRIKPNTNNEHPTYVAPGYPTIIDLEKDVPANNRYVLYLPKHEPALQIQCYKNLSIAKAYAEYYVSEYGLTYECEYYEIVD